VEAARLWARQWDDRTGTRSARAPARRTACKVIVDEARLLMWCKVELPAAVVIQERISDRTIKNYITQTGECPDGAEISAEIERFFVD
jgi:hypothetical protein